MKAGEVLAGAKLTMASGQYYMGRNPSRTIHVKHLRNLHKLHEKKTD